MENLPLFIVQLLAIAASILGIVAGFILFLKFNSFISTIMGLFDILFSLGLLSVELYVFSFMRYFGFMLTWWGKATMYLLMGALLFSKKGFFLFCSIVFWILFVAFIVIQILMHGSKRPIFQKTEPNLNTSSSEYFNGLGSYSQIKTETTVSTLN